MIVEMILKIDEGWTWSPTTENVYSPTLRLWADFCMVDLEEIEEEYQETVAV